MDIIGIFCAKVALVARLSRFSGDSPLLVIRRRKKKRKKEVKMQKCETNVKNMLKSAPKLSKMDHKIYAKKIKKRGKMYQKHVPKKRQKSSKKQQKWSKKHNKISEK